MRALRRWALVAALALLAPAAAAPAGLAAPPPPIGAPSAIVIDARTGEPLFERASHDERAIASTTKLMTAMVALERANPGDVFTAPPYSAAAIETKIGLREGERMTVRELLEAMMLPSANDAANALAVNIGGSRAAFVRMMNAQARKLGLRETRYSTPIGLDDPGNYSTASDLAKLAATLLRDRSFARLVDMPQATVRSDERVRNVVNRNALVRSHPFVSGVKTGHTLNAGYVLVGSAERGGARVVSVVLGTPSEAARDADSLALLEWGLDQFRRVTAVREERPYASAGVRWRGDDEVELVAARRVRLTVRRGERLTRRVKAPDEVKGPLAAGTEVGALEVVQGDRVVRTVPLVTASPVQGAGLLRRALSPLGGPLPAVALLALIGAAGWLALSVRANRGKRRERAAS
jgi:D-alanyl-D-alanine carboxypeptidase (penicillin-binding protein 5/6)